MSKKKPSESIFKEAWDNMSADFNNLLPDKMRSKGNKKKFVLWLFMLELVILGSASWFCYSWWIK